MTQSDARAFTFAAVLILAASATRYGVELRRDGAALAWDTASALPELLEVSRAELARETVRRTPLEEEERLDPNTASADQLDRLPGVGPATAQALVQAREQGVRFTVPEDLLRVPGIGPATLAKARAHLRLDSPSPSSERATRRPPPDPPGDRVDVNRADVERLQDLPGVGPALAQRIVELRTRSGPFTSVDQLSSVRGIGAATVERLRPHVRLRR